MQGDLFGRPEDWIKNVPLTVVREFERKALRVFHRGYERHSARDILCAMRWEHQIVKGQRDYAANNNWSPGLSRWFLAKHPEVGPDFFELRALGVERAA